MRVDYMRYDDATEEAMMCYGRTEDAIADAAEKLDLEPGVATPVNVAGYTFDVIFTPNAEGHRNRLDIMWKG